MDSKRAKSIFLHAVEHVSPDEWPRYLGEACGDEAPLRHAVAALLSAHREGVDLAEQARQACQSVLPTLDPPLLESPGTLIGPYKLLEPIGEGGFGVVFLAEQTQPVRRKVALKILKPGMDTQHVIARFEAERQTLALMDHPNIAQVFDGGATESGRPYLVMELVRGVPLTEYCDQHQLTPRQRLELFIPVCQAVQHAHQKGIIHRDLKPANVLITVHDTRPVAKVIDFGVAKVLGQELTEKSLFNGISQMVGTLEFMSPEQAGLNQLDIDTRSDIYSLGVLLYELLTGTTPLERQRVNKSGVLESLRVIREDEVPTLSNRLSTTNELAAIAAHRGLEPARLAAIVRGELNWIVMKALEKDRNRRYESASALVADIHRYLADEPVQACPPSAWYRFRKFTRRNKVGLAVATLVLTIPVLLGSGVGWMLRDQAARTSKTSAQVELVVAEVDQLEGEQKWPQALAAARRAAAVVVGGEVDTATAQRVQERLKDLEFLDRLEKIRMQQAMTVNGKVDYAGIDRDYVQAFNDYGVDIDAWAVEMSIDRLKAHRALVIPLAAALDDWSDVRAGPPEEDDTGWKRLVAIARGIDPEPMRVQVRSTWEHLNSTTIDELSRLADSLDIAAQHPATLVSLARTLRRVKQSTSALRILRDGQHAYPGDFWLNFFLGSELNEHKKPTEAMRFWTAAVAIRPDSASAYMGLGNALHSQKRLDEASIEYRKALEVDFRNARVHNNLGFVLFDQKKPDEAIAEFRIALQIDPTNAKAHNNLGVALQSQNKLDEAIAEYREANSLDPKYADAHSNLGDALREQEKLDEAIAAYHKAIELNPQLVNAHHNLAIALKKQNKLDEAIAEYRKVLEIDPSLAIVHYNLGLALKSLNKVDEAIAEYRLTLQVLPKHANCHYCLGIALIDQGKLDEAVAAYREAIRLKPDHASAHLNLARVLATYPDPKFRDPQLAIEHARKAIELNEQPAEAWQLLGWAQYRLGAWLDSIQALERSCQLQADGTRESGQWIVLALAHAKLAALDNLSETEHAQHQAEARRWFEQADQQIKRIWPVRPDDDQAQTIWDFRDEARKLLKPQEDK